MRAERVRIVNELGVLDLVPLGEVGIVVTVYEPDPALWRPGFKRRRKR